jgi:hypothetical protein
MAMWSQAVAIYHATASATVDSMQQDHSEKYQFLGYYSFIAHLSFKATLYNL